MKKNNQITINKTTIYLWVALVAAISIPKTFLTLGWRNFTKAMTPILVAVIITFFMEALVSRILKRWFAGKPKGRKKAVLLSYSIVALVVIIFFWVFSTPLRRDIQVFYENITSQSFVVNLSEKVDSLFGSNSYQFLLAGSNDLSIWFQTNFRSLIFTTFNTTATSMLQGLFIVAVAVYMSLDYNKFIKWLVNKLSAKSKKSLNALNDIRKGMKAWSKGWLKDQGFVFVLTLGFLWLLGIESFFTLSVIMTVFNFVPFFGPIIGGALIWIYIIATFVNIPGTLGVFGLVFIKSNTMIIISLIGLIIIQTVESLWWIPRVYSREIKINPLSVLVSLSIITTLISPLFAPLTIPSIVIGQAIYKNFFYKK